MGKDYPLLNPLNNAILGNYSTVAKLLSDNGVISVKL